MGSVSATSQNLVTASSPNTPMLPECTVLSDIIVDESNPKHADNNCAVKLYYADEGEDIWEIAKKYSTSINAIMEENNFSDEKISERSMMLIPMIG